MTPAPPQGILPVDQSYTGSLLDPSTLGFCAGISLSHSHITSALSGNVCSTSGLREIITDASEDPFEWLA